MIYSELQATVSATGACDSSASGDPVGPSYAEKTIGYSSRFLAYGTLTDPGPNCDEQNLPGGFHTIDFSQLYYTPIVTSTVSKAGCPPYVNPRLSLPADLTDVDPAWKTCQPLYYGGFDPPSFLSKASRLAPAPAGPAVVTPTPPPAPPPPATAQATPAAETPVETPAPSIPPKKEEPKAGANDPSASVIDSNGGALLNGNTHETAAPPAPSPKYTDLNSQGAAAVINGPTSKVVDPGAAVVASSPVQTPASRTDPNSQKADKGNNDSSDQVEGPSAAVIVNSPVQTSANIVVANSQTLTENGPTASIGGKAAVYSAGSVYYDSRPIPIPKASSTNVVVAQGQTLTENGPSAVVGGKTATYKAGSIYYDSTSFAIPTSPQGQPDPPPVVAAGVTFTPTVQTPSRVVRIGLTFAPAVQKASPVFAGGITFEPQPQPVGGDTSDLAVAGGITFQPSHIQSSNAVALETPAPLSVGSIPVLKAANGGLVVAGTTISPGSTTSLFGHVIEANSGDVVLDGTTHSLASVTADPVETPTSVPLEIDSQPVTKAANGGLIIAGTTISPVSQTSLFGHVISVGDSTVVDDGKTLTIAAHTEAAGQQSVASLLYGTFSTEVTLTSGATYSSNGHLITYSRSTPSVVTGTASGITGTTTVPLQTSTLPDLVFVEASASATLDRLFVEASPSAEEYMLNGTTATVASPSDVPIGGVILAGLDIGPSNGSAPINLSVLPSIILVNNTGASKPTSQVASSPGSTSEPVSKASPTSPTQGTGGRVMSWRTYPVVLGYLLWIALIM